MKVKQALRNWRSAYHNFLEKELWSPQVYAEARDPMRQSMIVVARTLYLVISGFSREKLRLRAAALTYMTLLSLVPALAVVFAVFAGFESLASAREQLKLFVVSSISVAHQETVGSYLDQFIGQVGALGGVSVIILLFTTVSLIANIEKSFNDIWGLKQSRSWVQRFQAYWPLLTLAPFLLGVSLALSAKIESSETYAEVISLVPILGLVGWLMPLALTWSGFTLMYLVIPNTRVPFQFAVLGGVVAGSIHEIAKGLFALYASKAITYSAIYGSFGVIPLLIIGVYVNWLVALTGGLLTYASQNALTYEPQDDTYERISSGMREKIALKMLMAIFIRFENGLGPTSTTELLSTIGGPPRAKRKILDELNQAAIIIATDEAFTPGQAAHNVTIAQILRVVRESGGSDINLDSPDPRIVSALELLDVSHEEQMAKLSKTSLAQLIAQVDSKSLMESTVSAHEPTTA
ncbi:MAG: YihY family inner membrane protein [Myxococcota bacterium]|nr:YihY family inner membrane protein [Myxococcota bacterium]